MRHTTLHESKELTTFVEKAAAWFAANPKGASYGDMKPGSIIALRWGANDDCVLVVRLDEYFEPLIFGQAIRNI